MQNLVEVVVNTLRQDMGAEWTVSGMVSKLKHLEVSELQVKSILDDMIADDTLAYNDTTLFYPLKTYKLLITKGKDKENY